MRSASRDLPPLPSSLHRIHQTVYYTFVSQMSNSLPIQTNGVISIHCLFLTSLSIGAFIYAIPNLHGQPRARRATNICASKSAFEVWSCKSAAMDEAPQTSIEGREAVPAPLARSLRERQVPRSLRNLHTWLGSDDSDNWCSAAAPCHLTVIIALAIDKGGV